MRDILEVQGEATNVLVDRLYMQAIIRSRGGTQAVQEDAAARLE